MQAGKWILEILLGSLPGALIYSLIFLLLSVVLIVVCQKYGFYTRKNRAWNILTKIHYVVLVLTFVITGFCLGLISSFQRASNEILDEHLHGNLMKMVPPLKEKILESLPPELADRPMTGQDIYDYVVEKAAATRGHDEEVEGVIANVAREIEIAAIRHVTKLVIDRAILEASQQLGLSQENAEFTLETFKNMDLAKRADEIATSLTDTAKLQVSGFANGLRIQVLVSAGTIILFLLIDPLIYFLVCVRRRRKKEAAAAEVEVEAEEVTEVDAEVEADVEAGEAAADEQTKAEEKADD